jgi:integrase
MPPSSEPNINHNPLLLTTAINDYLESRAKGLKTGSYHATANTVLTNWHSWCTTQGIETLGDLNPQVMRRYAQHLRRRSRAEDGISAASARTYYAIVRGCLSWCVKDSRLESNPADTHVATDELPDDSRKTESRQSWKPEDIVAITQYVNETASEAIENDGLNANGPVRDRALVHTITYSGVRGAEILSSPTDNRDGRNGITWNRINLDAGTMTVLGKNQEWEETQLPAQAVHALKQHYRVQNPTSDDWTVFSTRHAPSLYKHAREELAAQGTTTEKIETLLEEADTATDLLREHDIAPPALTTEGARSIMKRLCADADISIDGEYLKPHGARRGLGDILYREQAELAQTALRHESVETTHASYSDISASETSESVSNVLDTALGSSAGTNEDDDSGE